MKMSERIKKMLAAKRAAFTAAETRNKEATTAEELRSVGATLLALKDEIAELEAALAAAEAEEAAAENTEEKPEENRSAAAGAEQRGFNPVATYGGAQTENRGSQQVSEAEQRAKNFAASNRMTIGDEETRAVLISSGDIATPTKVDGIKDQFNTVSSIVDMVYVENCVGMGKHRVALETEDAEATEQTEGGEANNSEPKFKYVDIDPTSVAVTSQISKQVRKQSPLNYTEKVRRNALTALRKRAVKIITDAIIANVDGLAVELPLDAIDETTLRKIALHYGGEENVVGNAVLQLNKNALIAFGDIRGTEDKKPVYEITPDTSNPNTGIIKDGGLSVKYCINSRLTDAQLVYGQPQNFELDLFSPYEIVVSEEHAITKLMLTIVGDVELGGKIIKKDGFVIATVGAGA